MSGPNPQWLEAAAGRVRQVIASTVSLAGRSVEDLDRLAVAIAIHYSISIEAPTRQGVIDQLAEILGAEGYFVSKKVAWEKTGEFRKRMKLPHKAFQKILASPVCPHVELHRGRGRKQILAINSNPVFESFVLAIRGKTPKRTPGVKTWKPKNTIAEGRPSRRKPAHLLKRARMAGSKRNYTTS
jgi:hypothetical protein